MSRSISYIDLIDHISIEIIRSNNMNILPASREYILFAIIKKNCEIDNFHYFPNAWLGGYETIKKIVEKKNKKDLILNLRHGLTNIRLLCEMIIERGYESIYVNYLGLPNECNRSV